jgi:aminoglycoside 6'-N-acetyltransferase
MKDIESDYQLMLKWLTDERVLKYYEGRDKKFTIESIREKYSPRIMGREQTTPCIIEYKKIPIGYIQFYNDRKPDEIFKDTEDIYGVDLFIGEPTLWNQGLGSHALRKMVQYLFEKKNASKIIIDPSINNLRAIRAYKKAGFRKLKIIPGCEPHEGEILDAWLMVHENPVGK